MRCVFWDGLGWVMGGNPWTENGRMDGFSWENLKLKPRFYPQVSRFPVSFSPSSNKWGGKPSMINRNKTHQESWKFDQQIRLESGDGDILWI